MPGHTYICHCKLILLYILCLYPALDIDTNVCHAGCRNSQLKHDGQLSVKFRFFNLKVKIVCQIREGHAPQVTP